MGSSGRTSSDQSVVTLNIYIYLQVVLEERNYSKSTLMVLRFALVVETQRNQSVSPLLKQSANPFLSFSQVVSPQLAARNNPDPYLKNSHDPVTLPRGHPSNRLDP